MRFKNFFTERPVWYWTSVLLVSVIAFIAVFTSRWTRLHRDAVLTITKVEPFYLSKSTDLEGLATKLDSLGWVDKKKEFRWAGRLLGWNHFRRGRYELPADINYDNLFDKLGKGLQDPLNLTVLPGTDLESFQRRLAQRFAFDSTAVRQVFADSSFLQEKSLSRQHLFGRMLPDTYQFYWTESPKVVISKILEHFQDEVAGQYGNRIHEIRFDLGDMVTLASIIEWEARREDEKKTISGLYWNRLNRGMRLQADPTVLFALGERRRLYYKDYEIDHPYNTYIHKGLPPGPITNPGLGSIEAALYPADHDFLYMVATPEGTHLFSETYEQHKQKSRDWREWLQKQYRIKERREAAEQQRQNKQSTR